MRMNKSWVWVTTYVVEYNGEIWTKSLLGKFGPEKYFELFGLAFEDQTKVNISVRHSKIDDPSKIKLIVHKKEQI